MPSAALWALSEEKIIFYLGFRKVCGLFGSPFSRKGGVTERYFSAKNGKGIASFVCFLHNTGKIYR